MEEDLIKKLEKVEFPEIEIPGHKANLKKALIDFKYGKKERRFWEPASLFSKRSLAFSLSGGIVALLLLTILLNFPVEPQYALAEVEQIALENQEIRGLISEGGKIQDIKIIDKKAYVLITDSKKINLPAFLLQSGELEENRKETAVLAEISLKKRMVVEIKEVILKLRPLTNKQKERAEEIFKSSAVNGNSKIKEIIPTAPSFSKLEIVSKNGGAEVSSTDEQNAKIRYETEGTEKEAEINITKGSVESVRTVEKDN